MITNIAKKNLHGLSVGQRRVLEHGSEFLVDQQLGTKLKHSWNDIVDRMVYGKRSYLQQILMRLSKGEPVWPTRCGPTLWDGRKGLVSGEISARVK